MPITRSPHKRTPKPRVAGRAARTNTRLQPVAVREPRRVLLATDGSRPSSAAIKLARIMAANGAWIPEVITVSLPLPVAVGDMMLPMPPAGYEIMVNDSVLAGIRQQLKRYGDDAWSLSMEFGRPASAIVSAAARSHADLVVLGLGRHGRLGRLFGAETPAHVARHAKVPMLAVHDRAWQLPHVALAAVDFSDASVRAAREAFALLEPPGRLHLVHVRWAHNMTSFADSEWEQAYAVAAEAGFARLREKLGERAGIEITTALLSGGVIERVLKEAQSVQAKLLALGSHNENVLERVMIGSTPAQLLRAARCSVLIAPPGHVAS
jgi:nucleotide-binding universal stress UspA family protein